MNFFELLINLLNASLMVYTFYLFFLYFADKRMNAYIHCCGLIAIAITLTAILSFTSMGILRTLLICSIPLLISLLFKLKWYSHILLSVLVYALAGVCEFAVTILLSFTFSITTQVATQGFFKLVGIILSKTFLIILLLIIKLFKYRFSYSLTVKKTLTLLIIPISTSIISLIHINLFVNYPIESQTVTYSSLISYGMLILSNIIIFHLIDHSYQESEKEKQLTTVTELLHSQAKQYEQMQEHNNMIMKLRHDHKNLVIGLISELENGKFEDAKNQLKDQLGLMIKPDEFDFNNIISTVIKAKSDSATKNGITIDFQYSELNKIQISPVDIAIILGNALDNAIEATLKISTDNKTIHTIVKVNHDLIVIIIKNPVDKPIDTTHLISTKRNNGSYGFGIASIQELAKKHGGEAIFTYENFSFETNIVLRNINE